MFVALAVGVVSGAALVAADPEWTVENLPALPISEHIVELGAKWSSEEGRRRSAEEERDEEHAGRVAEAEARVAAETKLEREALARQREAALRRAADARSAFETAQREVAEQKASRLADGLAETQAELKTTRLELEAALAEVRSLEAAAELQATLHAGNLPWSYYEEVRRVHAPASGRDEKLDWLADIVMHDLGRRSWAAEKLKYRDRSGRYAHRDALRTLRLVLENAEVSEEQDEQERMRRILDWMNDHLAYEHEIDDLFRAPIETLSLGSGDCDDWTGLAAALMNEAGIDAAAGWFTRTDEEGKERAHMMLLVPAELGTKAWWFKDLSKHGLPGGWHVVEPQRRLDEQKSPNIRRWSLVAARAID